jgi:hypothetical protein
MDANERKIAQLERRRIALETILRHRDFYIEMIDWTAMTKDDRERVEIDQLEHIWMQLWEIDCQLDRHSRWRLDKR